MRLTENFTLAEFRCKDGSAIPIDVMDNIRELAENLQKVRDELDLPITINSGYRSPEYNKRIGGAKFSQHKLGKAADITIQGMTPDEVADFLEGLMDEGFIKQGGLGRYNTFTHYDIRGTEARWDNRT